jgi:hypothetical protein
MTLPHFSVSSAMSLPKSFDHRVGERNLVDQDSANLHS